MEHSRASQNLFSSVLSGLRALSPPARRPVVVRFATGEALPAANSKDAPRVKIKNFTKNPSTKMERHS